MNESVERILPFALLAVGVGSLYLATRPKKKKFREDRTGEICDPMDSPPLGYKCKSDDTAKHFKLYPETKIRLGYQPFADKKDVDDTIEELGFFNGDVKSFQNFMSQTTKWDLRTDGVIDQETLKALKEAKELLSEGDWHKEQD